MSDVLLLHAHLHEPRPGQAGGGWSAPAAAQPQGGQRDGAARRRPKPAIAGDKGAWRGESSPRRRWKGRRARGRLATPSGWLHGAVGFTGGLYARSHREAPLHTRAVPTASSGATPGRRKSAGWRGAAHGPAT